MKKLATNLLGNEITVDKIDSINSVHGIVLSRNKVRPDLWDIVVIKVKNRETNDVDKNVENAVDNADNLAINLSIFYRDENEKQDLKNVNENDIAKVELKDLEH